VLAVGLEALQAVRGIVAASSTTYQRLLEASLEDASFRSVIWLRGPSFETGPRDGGLAQEGLPSQMMRGEL